MKRLPRFTVFLGIALLTGFSAAFYFQQTHKNYFISTIKTYQHYQGSLKALEADKIFLGQHQKELTDFTKRGWLIPKSRLTAAEIIHQCGGNLSTIRFTFAPETVREWGDGYSFKTTKIMIHAKSLLDTYFYIFLEKILIDFPGILILQKFSLSRTDRSSNFIEGEIIYEWVAMEDNHYTE